jgi:hypothetical protein
MGIKLYCDNPQCGKVIEDEKITYDEERGEIYHVGGCGIEATAIRSVRAGNIEIQNVDYISLEKALILLKQGKLKQSEKLEEKVKH